VNSSELTEDGNIYTDSTRRVNRQREIFIVIHLSEFLEFTLIRNRVLSLKQAVRHVSVPALALVVNPMRVLKSSCGTLSPPEEGTLYGCSMKGAVKENFSLAGDQELFLRPLALNLPASHAGVTEWLTCSPMLVRIGALVCSYSSTRSLPKELTSVLPETRLCCKDKFEARKIVNSISLCRDLKEAQDELGLPHRIASV
jgi:hypothetical protein